MSIGKSIKELRKEKKLTQKQLGEIFNISHDTISLWEKGKSMPDAEFIKKICVFFDISADELLEIETETQRKEIKINNSFNNFNNHGTINIKN